MSELKELIRTLKDTYDGNAWHGPSVKAILSKLDPTRGNARIGNAHSVNEIILHMVAWRQFVIHRLQRNNTFDIDEQNNFPSPTDFNSAVADLDKSQQELIEALEVFDENKLHQIVPTRKDSWHKVLHGIIHHDMYHLGQIVMITKQF